MNSILTSIKMLLGITENDTSFDGQIIMLINRSIANLRQMGIGPAVGYSITTKNDTWANYIDDMSKLANVKDYIYCTVKLIFDPPQSSSAIEAFKNAIAEDEFRLQIANEDEQ